MSRLIRKFVGDKARSLPPIEFYAEDFNKAEPWTRKLKQLTSSGFVEEDNVSIDMSCSEKSPGITLSVRDTDMKIALDEQQTIDLILQDLTKADQSIWDINAIRVQVEKLVSSYVSSVMNAKRKLYVGTDINVGGTICSNRIPIGIFQGFSVNNEGSLFEYPIHLKDYVGRAGSALAQVQNPYIEFLTGNNLWRIYFAKANFDEEENAMYLSMEDKKFFVIDKDRPHVEVPPEIFEASKEEKLGFLRSSSTSRQRNRSCDIDLF